MLKRNRKKILVAIIVTIIVLGTIFLLPITNSITSYLSKTKKVDANLLIVEGWLPPYAIEMANDEFQKNGYDLVITTGLKISGYYLVSMNGYLIFNTHDRFKGIDKTGDHTIEIDAYSEMGDKNCAHFNAFVNDSMVADFLTDKKKRKYEITWKGKLAKIDSVMIQFDNDRFFENDDRNLYVKEIIIDHNIHISYQNNSEYDIGALDGKNRINNNFSSFSELARNKLLLMGLDSSSVLAVPGKRVKINRTLTSALAFRDWLKTTDIDIKGINIISMGTHSRRTWMTYNKILNERYKIGIISLPDYRMSHSRKKRILKTLRETAEIVYYWFILIPY